MKASKALTCFLKTIEFIKKQNLKKNPYQVTLNNINTDRAVS